MYIVVNTLALSFLIESSTFMQVRKTIILSRTSSNFNTIGPDAAELAFLERLKNTHRLTRGDPEICGK